MINKDLISRVVDDCYSSPYKIFSINSRDGINSGRSLGLFVSLGITTSMTIIRMVMNRLKNQFPENNVAISEIESRLIDGRYTNKLSRSTNVTQYNSGSIQCRKIISEDELCELVSSLKNKILENKDNDKAVLEYSCRMSKVAKIINKIRSSDTYNWNDYSVSVINTDKEFSISVVNNKINYIQEKEVYNGSDIIVHKRIGIFVEY